MPASSDSRRSERRAVLRCSRMNEPRSRQRSLGSVLTFVSVVRTAACLQVRIRPTGATSVRRRVVRVTSLRTTPHDDRRDTGDKPLMADYTLPDLPYDYAALE